MNRLLLWSVARLAPVWQRLGADPRALRLILASKMKIGDRSLKMMGQTRGKSSDYTILIYCLLFIFGSILVFLYLAIDDKATAVGMIFTFISVYLGFMLVTEMTDTLFDTRDLTLLYSRPVTDATLSLSRGLYVYLFASKFVLPLTIPLGLALLYLAPLLVPVYALLCVLLTVIVVSMTLGLYLTLLRRMSPDRLRRVMGYLQVVLTTLFIVLYQLPNLINLTDSGDGVFDLRIVGTAWGFCWPGFWLGGVWDSVTYFGARPLSLVQGLLGIGAAAVGVRYYVSQGSNYGSQLMGVRIAGSEPADDSPEKNLTPVFFARYRNWWGRLTTRTGPERGSYRFNAALMTRDFNYKQQVYPGLLIPLLIAVGFAGQRLVAGGDPLGPGGVITSLYIFAILIVSPLVSARLSENFRAGWVWQTNPVERLNPILYGQLMAVVGLFFVPVGLVVYVCVGIVAGAGVFDDILLSLAAILLASILFQYTERSLPFSQEKNAGGFQAIGPMFLILFLGSLAGLAHYGLTFIPYGVALGTVVAWVVCLLALRGLRR
ncbi:hypothetical protein CLV84_0761 [Neolewinella xylanilytica]|uniref:ABC-2 type transport system permease protein n=1 Tax=Neolewinella xylanilytica TaxID=1514080 RepID=A0A2S6I8K1_9BACT|nr:hypothetical protein [Neolewinella xylanilytica]PPK87808.1 hypothetical protein CLV84_0761 [Neolewinella xylanilytica]